MENDDWILIRPKKEIDPLGILGKSYIARVLGYDAYRYIENYDPIANLYYFSHPTKGSMEVTPEQLQRWLTDERWEEI